MDKKKEDFNRIHFFNQHLNVFRRCHLEPMGVTLNVVSEVNK